MRKLAIFSGAFAIGVLGYVMLLPPWLCGLLFIVSVAGAVALRSRSARRDRAIRLAAIGLAFSLLWCFAYEQGKLSPLQELDGKTEVIKLLAMEDGDTKDKGCKLLCKSGSERVLLYLKKGSGTVRMGDELKIRAKLESVDPREDLYYISKDITLFAYGEGELQVGRQGVRWWQYPSYLYKLLQIRIGQMFPADAAPFLRALLTGNTNELNYGLKNRMSLVGISHVVAVSGMHVSLICSLVMLLCLRRRRLAAGVCLVAMWFFAAMLGFTPSVTRAVLMNSLMLLAPLLTREYDPPTSICFALLLLLLPNPWAIRSVGLQLSFGAVAGIMLFTKPLCSWLRRLCKIEGLWSWLASFLNVLISSASTTIGASLLTLPLCAYYFGTVSLISILSNLLLLPVLTFIFTLSYPLVLSSFFVYPVAAFLGQLMAWPVRGVILGIDLLAKVPFGALYTQSPYVVAWLIAAYLVFALGYFGKRPLPALLLIVCMLLSVPIFQGIRQDALRFTMLDVGQGQCLLAEAGDAVIVIDCGGSHGEQDGENAARTLLSRSRQRIHALILTHYDLDHVGGTLQLMERMKVEHLYLPDVEDDKGWREKILEAAQEHSVPVSFVRQDCRLKFDGGSLDIFAPMGTKTGNDGLSLLLSEGEYDILITGDLPIEGERALLLSRALPDIEVMVAGHHGATDSTSPQLLQYCHPELLLISVGQNSYGHPTPQVLKRAKDIGARVYRTDQDGTIIITR